MNRWTLAILLALALPACAQDGLSKAGIPFSPTQPFGYPTVERVPTNSGYGYGSSNYYYGGYNYYGNQGYGHSYQPGGFDNPFRGSNYVPAQSGRSFPSAAQESRLHEIRR